MENKVLENLSWIPYNILIYFGKKKKSPVDLKLEKLGIYEKIKMILPDDDEGLSAQLKTFGIREPLNFKYYYKFIEKDDVLLDVGANVGAFTLLGKKAKKIICIEPLKNLIPYLKKNIKLNKLEGKTEIINMALGKKGKLFLEVNEKMNLSKIIDKENEKTISIKSEPLEFFTKKYDGNLLKLDVEGYEYEILHKKIPKKINKISMEFHSDLLGKEKSKKLLNYFEKENFKVIYFIEDLPIRLYPFYGFLKNIGLLKKLTYVKKNLSPKDCFPEIVKGRGVKYLYLER